MAVGACERGEAAVGCEVGEGATLLEREWAPLLDRKRAGALIRRSAQWNLGMRLFVVADS
jgi:hypothetical protein